VEKGKPGFYVTQSVKEKPKLENLSLLGKTKLFKPIFHHLVSQKRHFISHQKKNKGMYSSSNFHPLGERNAAE